MKDRAKSTPEETLMYFLRLSLARLESRFRARDPRKFDQEMRRMRLLEELIKEQLPDENIRSAIGASR